ncbi:MAG: hypothetical protein H0W02_11615 [Ktedonobacteraceae bacterium]|nr:hypothetical protein [Ktedonobacteraceae bacterium]
MRWSKLKKSLEDLLAEAVKEHLQMHFTRYGRSLSSVMDRAWITWDKEEIHTFSTVGWLRGTHSVATQMYEAGERKELPVWYDFSEEVVKRLEQSEVFSRQQWYEALQTYLSLSIEQALHSSNVLIRAWAMFDRRLGKRRLRSMEFQPTDPPFVKRWYQLRCQAEGIPVGSAGHDQEGT